MTFDQFCLQCKTTDEEREVLHSLLLAHRIMRYLNEMEPLAVILLRTIAAEAQRTGSWQLPPDLQERITMFLAERDRGGRVEGGA